jgi:hypothetical protein
VYVHTSDRWVFAAFSGANGEQAHDSGLYDVLALVVWLSVFL